MGRQIIDRETERASLEDFLSGAGSGFAALILEGEPGIGKSAVWDNGLAVAQERGCTVLTTRSSQAEATFSFAGLGDLVDDTPTGALQILPEPQRNALEVALLKTGASGRAPDRRAVAVAVLGMLRAAAQKAPVLVAIDDLQWLDRETAAVLGFALRRLNDERVRLLATLRATEDDPLTRVLDACRVERVALRPMSAGELHESFMAHLGDAPSRPTMSRIHEISGGNPFFALELGRSLQGSGAELRHDHLPVPESLASVVRGHLSGLPAGTREVLLHVAAMARPARPTICDGLPRRLNPSGALRRAADSHVIEVDGERVRFAHPLLRSVLYGDASPADHRRVHRRLARLVTDPEERAWHLALSADRPDAELAATLDEASDIAAGRGPPTRQPRCCDTPSVLRLRSMMLRSVAEACGPRSTSFKPARRKKPAGC